MQKNELKKQRPNKIEKPEKTIKKSFFSDRKICGAAVGHSISTVFVS
jgi:hypothetical protein